MNPNIVHSGFIVAGFFGKAFWRDFSGFWQKADYELGERVRQDGEKS